MRMMFPNLLLVQLYLGAERYWSRMCLHQRHNIRLDEAKDIGNVLY